MNLFGLNLSLNRNSRTEIRKSGDEVPLSDAALRWLRGEDVPQRPCLANAYEQVVWVYRAPSTSANPLPMIPPLPRRVRDHDPRKPSPIWGTHLVAALGSQREKG